MLDNLPIVPTPEESASQPRWIRRVVCDPSSHHRGLCRLADPLPGVARTRVRAARATTDRPTAGRKQPQMPCHTPVAEGKELELGWVQEFLYEFTMPADQLAARLPIRDEGNVAYWHWGCRDNKQIAKELDEKTAELCGKCREAGEEKIATMTPELQAWWKKHKAFDATEGR